MKIFGRSLLIIKTFTHLDQIEITLGGQAYLCDHIIAGHRLGIVTGSRNDFIGLRAARNID